MRIKAHGHRKDDNHGQVKRMFEDLLCKVLDISSVPNACDLIVKRGSQVRFIEIKDPTKPPSKRKLTKGEADFHREWGDVIIVMTEADVIRTVEGMI